MHSVSRKIYLKINSLTLQYPRLYLAGVTAIAVTAYLFLLLFPVLVVVGSMSIYDAITAATIDWVGAAIWFSIVIIAAFVSYQSMQVKFAQPVGLSLTRNKAPALFKLVQKLRESYGGPVIQRIIITDKYELDIIKTPKYILPVWSTNTLLIGLPVLQCHTPQHFDCLLARRIGQFSKRDNKLTNWLYQLRATWSLYYSSIKRQKIVGTDWHSWFFFAYAPFYSAASTFAARIDEIKADNYAMELYNNEVIREMITADTVYQRLLQNQYWPAVNKIKAVSEKSQPRPHAKMSMAVRNKINEKTLVILLNNAMKQESDWHDTKPSINRRLENIGHDSPKMHPPEGDAAVDFYLKDSKNTIINLLDKLWLKTAFNKRRNKKT